MLYKSLHFKLVLMLVLFIICIISFIGVTMLNFVFGFYTDNFNEMMSENLDDDILKELSGMMTKDDFYIDQKERLKAQYGNLGINHYRNIYILDMDGTYLAGSNDEFVKSFTANMLAAMNKKVGDKQSFGEDYMDYAVYLSSDMYGSKNQDTVRECIIYIKDTREEMKRISWAIFSIIIQVLLLGLGIAVVLSFFFAKAITSPIQSITRGALKLADGDFKRKIDIAANDEVGTLALTFNDMAEKLEATYDEVSSEREKLETTFLYLNDGVLVFSNEGKPILINPRVFEILKDGFGYENDFDDFLNLFDLNINTDNKNGENNENDKKDQNDQNDQNDNGSKNAGRIFKDVLYGENIFDISIGKFRYSRDEKNSPDGTIVVMHDVTQSYSLEKSRREFIANVSHELKTPLSSIRGAAESIADSRMGQEAKINFLNIIIREGERMTGIVEDLLIVSRLDNKKMMWRFTTVNLVDIVEKIYETKRVEAEKNDQKLTLKKSKNIPGIYADKERIEQVLVNIVSNAIKYTPKGGKIEIALSGCKIKSGDSEITGAKITVTDNGVGIPKEDLPHIFERFYRVEKARSTEAGGTGLGLSISKEIINAHRGEITVENAQGGGTVVTILLPQEMPRDAEEAD